ncbi:hypothetical protein [Paraflavitalea speifideaquila]|uniref:hypothetical protein n=1 Tax=Paraflavitalea speifideaquila TaxID=3076558 RepID=UPI0028E9A81B|nr:hypothetical protein [Paraflavitalea speifideiaquila]
MSAGKSSLALSNKELEISVNKVRHTDQTSLIAEVAGKTGEGNFLILPEGTLLSGCLMDQSNMPALEINTKKNLYAEIKVVSEQVNFKELNRLIIQDKQVIEKFSKEETFRLQVKPSGNRLVNAQFIAQPDTLPKKSVLYFNPKLPSQNITPKHTLVDFDIPTDSVFTINSCINPIIKIEGLDAPNQPKDMPIMVKIKSGGCKFAITGFDFNNEAKFWQLKLVGSGKASSILVENQELIPTQFDKIISGSLARTGLWFLVLSAVAAIIVTFFKRAIENLAEYFLPSPPKPGEGEEPKPDSPAAGINFKVLDNTPFQAVVETVVDVNSGICVFKNFTPAELAIPLQGKEVQATSVEEAIAQLAYLSTVLPAYTVEVTNNVYTIIKT